MAAKRKAKSTPAKVVAPETSPETVSVAAAAAVTGPGPAGPSGPRKMGRVAGTLLLSWVAIASALFLLAAPAPEPDPVDAQEEAARERLAEWAVRDAEQWQEREGDLTIPWASAQGHLAIVIDDVGRELDYFDKLLALRFPLSFSVLPGSVYAKGVQDRLQADQRRPREILLHLPMEPLDPKHMQTGDDAREDFLRASDSPAQLRAKVEAAMAVVP
ncbi:MAG: divergent polysaccharide deacetylase family protein, partial [Myxococcales bacterium]|nr:divergent polysaccharide deacetylase family protein [Myxococcales bacterium]